jgi:hypothetical protein
MISPGTYTVILNTASFCTSAASVEVLLSALRAKRAFAIVDVLDAFGREHRQEQVELSRVVTIVHHDVYADTLLSKYGPRSVLHLRDHVARRIAPAIV